MTLGFEVWFSEFLRMIIFLNDVWNTNMHHVGFHWRRGHDISRIKNSHTSIEYKAWISYYISENNNSIAKCLQDLPYLHNYPYKPNISTENDKLRYGKLHHHPSPPPPHNKVHGANMGLIWVRQDPGGPHAGPMNFAIWVDMQLSHQSLLRTHNDWDRYLHLQPCRWSVNSPTKIAATPLLRGLAFVMNGCFYFSDKNCVMHSHNTAEPCIGSHVEQAEHARFNVFRSKKNTM